MNTANKLTLSRFVMSLAFVILFYMDGWIYYQIAFFLFILASLTDFLDGYVARKYNQITQLGKLMDPLADKVLVFSALVILVERGIVFAWVVIVILSRDLMIGIFRAVAAQKGVVIAADIYGKIKTITQMLSTMLILFGYAFEFVEAVFIGILGLYLAVALTVFSGFNYVYKNREVLRD